MNRYFLSFFWNLRTLLVFCILYSASSISQSAHPNSSICTRLTIDAAQLAHQSYLYCEDSYFSKNVSVAEKNIDTAIFYIKESISVIDSTILLANSLDTLGIKYTQIAKQFASDSYKTLIQFKQNQNSYAKRDLSKKASFYATNTTADAYRASFYFKGDQKPKQKVKDSILENPTKLITKLDIDQTLFALLKEELHGKEEENNQEISKLSEELNKVKDASMQQKLKSQLKNLQSKEQDISKKSKDAEQKLSSINALIEERDKNKNATIPKEETVFAKSIFKTTDEWNKQIKMDSEVPEGLIYQVQLGVYKHAVLPAIFKGLTPIYGKTTEDGISYSTGLFEKLIDAREAKSYVLNMGLKDAFIVAYYNKRKISLAEAQKLEKK